MAQSSSVFDGRRSRWRGALSARVAAWTVAAAAASNSAFADDCQRALATGEAAQVAEARARIAELKRQLPDFVDVLRCIDRHLPELVASFNAECAQGKADDDVRYNGTAAAYAMCWPEVRVPQRYPKPNTP
jgi:hypothetical protein